MDVSRVREALLIHMKSPLLTPVINCVNSQPLKLQVAHVMRSGVRWTVAGTTAVALYFNHFFTSTAVFTPESLGELKNAVEACVEPSPTTPSGPERIKLKQTTTPSGPQLISLKKTGPTVKEPDYIVINGTRYYMKNMHSHGWANLLITVKTESQL